MNQVSNQLSQEVRAYAKSFDNIDLEAWVSLTEVLQRQDEQREADDLTAATEAATLRRQWVVCAANKYGKYVVCGARHYDSVMHVVIGFIRSVAEGRGGQLGTGEQGFIDQYGTFLTRQEAWHIAMVNGQIVKRVGGDTAEGGTLFSENLY